MRCPNCGTENNNLATRCSACGSPLPSATEDSAPTTPIASDAAASPGPSGTAERAVATKAPEPSAEDQPELHEIARSAGKYVQAKRNRASTFFKEHDKALGIGIALAVVATIAIVWVVAIFLNAPAYAQIERDMSERMPTYDYVGGTYGPDLQIPLSGLSVTKRDRAQTPAGFEANGGGGNAYRVEVEAVYDDGKMRVVRNVGATYVQQGDTWAIASELDEAGISFTALSGVDEGKVLANVAPILQAARSTQSPLDELYADGEFSIAGGNFVASPEQDTSTDDVIISCKKESGFFSYAGNVTARFAFESGEWRLRSAEADASAGIRRYEPLVGTWSGPMVSHEASGGSCYGAQRQQLSVTINTVGDPSQGGGQVQGAFTGMAHYHERLQSNASSNKGDKLLEGMTFTGVISTEYDRKTGSSLNVECTTPGSEDGNVDLVLSFGTDSDPSAVFARVTTTRQYEETTLFWFPRQATATFTDTYLLTRVEE